MRDCFSHEVLFGIKKFRGQLTIREVSNLQQQLLQDEPDTSIVLFRDYIQANTAGMHFPLIYIFFIILCSMFNMI